MTNFDLRRLGIRGRNRVANRVGNDGVGWQWSRRRFLALGLAAGLLAIVPACVPSSLPPPLRVGTNVWPGFEGFYLARDLGYFDDTPVQMVEFGSSSEVLRAYRNGDLEVAALTLDETLLLAETNPQVRIVLSRIRPTGGMSSWGSQVLPTSGICRGSGWGWKPQPSEPMC